MSVSIRVWSDYVCPFCLLAEGPIHEATEGLDVTVEWMPFELRPHPTPTLRPEGDYLQNIWARVVYPMARRIGVPIHLPDVSPQPYTRLAFEGYQYALEHGAGARYTPRVLRAFFQENRDIGQLDVLTDIAAELGLDTADFRKALEEGRYTRAHQKALALAEAHQITSVPTLIVGDVHRIEGVPDPKQLRAAIQAVAAEQAAADRTPWGASCGIDGCV